MKTADSPDFVEPAARVAERAREAKRGKNALFDNDGTLWCEKPMPVEPGFIQAACHKNQCWGADG